MKKIIKQALIAQQNGYHSIASIVNRYRYTSYYHVVPISRILERGDWIPAPHVIFPSGARGREGISHRKVDWTTTIRKSSLKNLLEEKKQ